MKEFFIDLYRNLGSVGIAISITCLYIIIMTAINTVNIIKIKEHNKSLNFELELIRKEKDLIKDEKGRYF